MLAVCKSARTVYVLTIYTYVRRNIRKEGRSGEGGGGEAFERCYPETKPSSRHCLGQTKQINRQPPSAPTTPALLLPALILCSFAFAPCCPTLFRLAKEAARSVQLSILALLFEIETFPFPDTSLHTGCCVETTSRVVVSSRGCSLTNCAE